MPGTNGCFVGLLFSKGPFTCPNVCASDFDVCHLDLEMISHLVVYHKGLRVTAVNLLLFL